MATTVNRPQVFAGLDLTAIDSGFAGWRQIHFVDQLFGPTLDTLGHFIQDIGCFMYPATSLPSRGKDYSVLPDSGYARREKQRRTPR
jgi:hypothetical protein